MPSACIPCQNGVKQQLLARQFSSFITLKVKNFSTLNAVIKVYTLYVHGIIWDTCLLLPPSPCNYLPCRRPQIQWRGRGILHLPLPPPSHFPLQASLPSNSHCWKACSVMPAMGYIRGKKGDGTKGCCYCEH